jgi:hypothetical protein
MSGKRCRGRKEAKQVICRCWRERRYMVLYIDSRERFLFWQRGSSLLRVGTYSAHIPII